MGFPDPIEYCIGVIVMPQESKHNINGVIDDLAKNRKTLNGNHFPP